MDHPRLLSFFSEEEKRAYHKQHGTEMSEKAYALGKRLILDAQNL